MRGQSLSQRAIQVGLSRHIVPRYVDAWIIAIRDITPLARKLYALIHAGKESKAQGLLPRERVYPVNAALARRLGMVM